MFSGDLLEPHEHFIKEESQPDAFALAVFAHKIHAVVPVAGADERQAMLPKSQAPENGPDAMLIQAGRFFRPAGQIIIRVLFRAYRTSFNEMDRLIQYAGIACAQNIAACSQRQPQVIIRTVRAHTPARRWMPPMLDVSFPELAGCAAEQVLAHEARLGVDERHYVLQLVAETEGAARLVVSVSSPKTAGKRLVQEPAIGQHIERLVGSFHLNCAKRVVPVLPHRLELVARCSRSAEAMRQVASVVGVTPNPELEDDLAFLSIGEFERNLDRGAGIQCGARSSRKGASGSWRPDSEACRCAQGTPCGRR